MSLSYRSNTLSQMACLSGSLGNRSKEVLGSLVWLLLHTKHDLLVIVSVSRERLNPADIQNSMSLRLNIVYGKLCPGHGIIIAHPRQLHIINTIQKRQRSSSPDVTSRPLTGD